MSELDQVDNFLKDVSLSGSQGAGSFDDDIKQVDAFFDETPGKNLEAVAQVGSPIPSDTAAKVINLNNQTGLPKDLIESDPQVVQAIADRQKLNLDRMKRRAPNVSDWLSENPYNFALAKNNLDGLQELEHKVQDHSIFRTLGDSFYVGLGNANKTLSSIPGHIYDLMAQPQNLLYEAFGSDRRVTSPEWLKNNPVKEYYGRGIEQTEIPELHEHQPEAGEDEKERNET